MGHPAHGRRAIGGGHPEPLPSCAISVYDEVGGQAFFDELVERFYKGVAADLLLRPLYPDDLVEPARHLAGFLAQYWGGPPAYSEERGHPRLRMRHAPFVITGAERDAWLRHMRAAVEEVELSDATRTQMLDYFVMAADAMINT